MKKYFIITLVGTCFIAISTHASDEQRREQAHAILYPYAVTFNYSFSKKCLLEKGRLPNDSWPTKIAHDIFEKKIQNEVVNAAHAELDVRRQIRAQWNDWPERGFSIIKPEPYTKSKPLTKAKL